MELSVAVGIALGVYVVATYGVALWSHGKVKDADDYLLAGRRLGVPLASATLLATWFGAGTLLTAADEVRRVGLSAVALEPLGSGLCLVVAGLLFARPLWSMGLTTVADFFARRFGPRAELAAALVMVPSYFGWIAVQFLALAHVLELFFGVPQGWGVLIVALVGTGYTLLGGMWSVTLTDALQLGLLLGGLVLLLVHVLSALGGGQLLAGPAALVAAAPEGWLSPLPRGELTELWRWGGLLVVAMLGNLPGQDLWQRMFAARSAEVARRACLIAGGSYIAFGAIPVVLGLSAVVLLPGSEGAIVPALAELLFTPAMVVVFTVALCSAVMSSIDSGLLSPATVLAKNVLATRWRPDLDLVRWSRFGVLLTAVVSVVVANAGSSAFGLLEDAYALGLVGLFPPLALGLATRGGRWGDAGEAPALAAMAVGTTSWVLHLSLGWTTLGGVGTPFPADLGGCLLACIAFMTVAAVASGRARATGSPVER